VWTIDSEAWVPVRGGREISNPDDPDGDQVEAIAWWDPAQLAGNPAVRPELLACLPDVLAALGCDEQQDDLAKAAASPKGPAPDGADQQPIQQAWPGWDVDLLTVAHWAPLLAAALAPAVNASALGKAWLALGASSDATTKPGRLKELAGQARTWLDGRRVGADLEAALGGILPGVQADGCAIGAASVHAIQLGQTETVMGRWQPGATDAARDLLEELDAASSLTDVAGSAKATAKAVAGSRLDGLARALAQAAESTSSTSELAQAITDTLTDPSKAESIVSTELANASNTAATQAYRRHGVQQVRWATADDDRVCPTCLGNEAAGARNLDEPFPSGDLRPPAHPRDRCALIPAQEVP
jgi:SPP1 gp7 family putative phage head morphogenesis protein